MTIDQQRLDGFLAGFAADQAAAMHMSTVVLGEQRAASLPRRRHEPDLRRRRPAHRQRLSDGGRVADLACGFGTTTVLMAEGFPAATVAGFDSPRAPHTHPDPEPRAL